MPFNFELMVTLRIKDDISRSDFAKLLRVSYNHIQKIETGQREPSLDLLRAISQYTGVPAGAFLDGGGDSSPEMMDGSDKMTSLMKLINDLNREKFNTKVLEDKNAEQGKLIDHILSVNELLEKYITILRLDASPVEKGKKIAALARSVIRAGEVRFDEVLAALNVTRRTLKGWLELEKGEYRCRLFDDRAVTATTPAEAGIRLKCFDCEARANENCRGYGENNYPENLFMLIAMLEANGIHGREKQAALLRESFDMDITAHQLADVLSKKKHGKRLSENLANMTSART